MHPKSSQPLDMKHSGCWQIDKYSSPDPGTAQLPKRRELSNLKSWCTQLNPQNLRHFHSSWEFLEYQCSSSGWHEIQLQYP